MCLGSICTPLVYSLDPLYSFFHLYKVCFLPIKKKKLSFSFILVLLMAFNEVYASVCGRKCMVIMLFKKRLQDMNLICFDFFNRSCVTHV